MNAPVSPCEGLRSPKDPARPAGICRSCERRITWQWQERRAHAIAPAAQFVGGHRMSCFNKIKATP